MEKKNQVSKIRGWTWHSIFITAVCHGCIHEVNRRSVDLSEVRMQDISCTEKFLESFCSTVIIKFIISS